MYIVSKLFKSRDKPKDSTNGSCYRYYFGGTTAGKYNCEGSVYFTDLMLQEGDRLSGYVINTETILKQAEIVKRIYREYLKGKSMDKI